jgi:hypothetical protein
VSGHDHDGALATNKHFARLRGGAAADWSAEGVSALDSQPAENMQPIRRPVSQLAADAAKALVFLGCVTLIGLASYGAYMLFAVAKVLL